MKQQPALMARIYLNSKEKLTPLIKLLQENHKISGFTIQRGIYGMGTTEIQSDLYAYLSLNLPITLEFFDTPDKVKAVINELAEDFSHITTWDVNVIKP